MPAVDATAPSSSIPHYDWRTIIISINALILLFSLLFLIWKGVVTLQRWADDKSAARAIKAAFKSALPLPPPAAARRTGRPRVRYTYERNWFTVQRPILPPALTASILAVAPPIYPCAIPASKIISFDIVNVIPRLPLGLIDPTALLAMRTADDEDAALTCLEEGKFVIVEEPRVPLATITGAASIFKKSTRTPASRRSGKENAP
ncbi:hypothetical protein HGRIS_009217 [Hohenbuehelia grisea]|uniref:ATP synthase F0 subunit 8 n=1 Tax=Hohenbuehelia grisea TaxID=104357 RepID=A0ABR3J0U1_9AGAR